MLFTVIMDFAGGKYISQVRAASAGKALRIWARDLDPRPIYRFGPESKKSLIAEVEEDASQPVPITGRPGVWCAALLIRGVFAMVNIVATRSST